jgi:hypothetical protein
MSRGMSRCIAAPSRKTLQVIVSGFAEDIDKAGLSPQQCDPAPALPLCNPLTDAGILQICGGNCSCEGVRCARGAAPLRLPALVFTASRRL